MQKSFDARAVANLVLAEVWGRGKEVSHLQLQKLVFLCHAFLLVERAKDVVRGDFVAWKLGPVHLDVYDAFEKFGRRSIDKLATRVSPVTGKLSEIEAIDDQDVRDVVTKVVVFYGDWSAGQLVTLTHAEGGPWDCVVKSAPKNANVGLRISSETIEKTFKFLWFGAKRELKGEDANEDQPLVA